MIGPSAAAATWDSDGAKPRYANKRAEMWGNPRDWLSGDGALPDDPGLRADLTSVEYGDIGDALALTFAHPVRPDWGWDSPPRVRILHEDHEYDYFHHL